jgi:hypothetical protein
VRDEPGDRRFKAVITGVGLTVGLIVLAINGTISVAPAIVASFLA